MTDDLLECVRRQPGISPDPQILAHAHTQPVEDGDDVFFGETVLQRVVMAGPYQYIRRPTYTLTVVLWLTTPLIFVSWCAPDPTALVGALMVLHTLLEDRMLHEELPGYPDCAQKTR